MTHTLERDAWNELFPEAVPTAPNLDAMKRLVGATFAVTEDPRLHFSIGVPRGFRAVSPAPAAPESGTAPLWRASDDTGAEIAVYADEIRHEMSPADWAELRLERLDQHPWAAREQDTSSGRMSDLLTRGGSNGTATVARTNTVKDGKRIFTIVCAAPETTYASLAHLFVMALVSFTLTHPEGAPHAEPLLTYSYLEPAIASVMHPASFDLMADGFDEDTFDIRLDARTEKGFLASLHAVVKKQETPQRFVADHFSRLDAAGIRIDERGPLVDAKAPKGFVRAFTLDATGTWGSTPVLVQALVLVNDAATVLLATTGPTRAHDGYGWAVARRALQIARDTVYAI